MCSLPSHEMRMANGICDITVQLSLLSSAGTLGSPLSDAEESNDAGLRNRSKRTIRKMIQESEMQYTIGKTLGQ